MQNALTLYARLGSEPKRTSGSPFGYSEEEMAQAFQRFLLSAERPIP
jgi:hypothetical protein